MLKFDRKEFRSGTIIVRETIPGPEKGEDGKPIMVEKQHLFSVKDKGSSFAFQDEAAILAKYPLLFSKV